MECSRTLVLVLLMAGCLLQEINGHYNKRRYPRSRDRLYSASRYRGYHSGYRPDTMTGMKTIFRSIYTRLKATKGRSLPAAQPPINTIRDEQTEPVVIRLPSSVVNNPNFKMSDLPFYLASGVFDPNNLPGPLDGPSLPTPIVDPVNPTGVFDTPNNDFNQVLGTGSNSILSGANTNVLGRANTNLLGGANTNLLGGANTNLLGGGSGSVLGGTNTNMLGSTNTNILGGTGVLGQGGSTGVLPTGNYNTQTGGSTNLFGNPTLTG